MSSKILFTSKSFNFNMEHKIQLSGLRRESDSKMQRCVFQCNVSGWTKKNTKFTWGWSTSLSWNLSYFWTAWSKWHIFTSDSAFRVGNLEMSNVFSALAKTVVQKEHTKLAVSHIHTFYMFDIFSKQVPCFDLFLVLWIPQTQLICGKHRLWLQSNSWILLQIHQLCADPFENRAGILRDLDQAGPWRDVFHEKSCFVWRWHHCVFFVSLELEIWEKACFLGCSSHQTQGEQFYTQQVRKIWFRATPLLPQ